MPKMLRFYNTPTSTEERMLRFPPSGLQKVKTIGYAYTL